MIAHSGPSRVRGEVLAIVSRIPAGRVASTDMIAAQIGTTPRHVATILFNLIEGERDLVPWHRVVAKGGAIGHGPFRDAQFARLMREGVAVSPAGIVQDMTRFAVQSVNPNDPVAVTAAEPTDAKSAAPPQARSRGMKDRP